MNDGTVIAGMRSEPTGVDTAKVSTNNRSLAAAVDAVHTPELFADLDAAIAVVNQHSRAYSVAMEKVLLLVNRLRIASGVRRGDYEFASTAGAGPASTTEGDGR